MTVNQLNAGRITRFGLSRSTAKMRTTHSPLSALVPGLALASALMLAPGAAEASGISVARFGGAHGNPTERNAYSIYYNPAGLAGVDGYQLSLDVNWAYRDATYDRPESAIDNVGSYTEEGIAANSGEGHVGNFVYSPMLGFASDFRTDLPFAIGFGFFAPFGGQSVWDETEPSDTYPGAVDGPARWYVIEGTIRTLAFSLGAAYEVESIGLSFGLAGNLYLSEIDTVRARVATGFDSIDAEGRSWLDVSTTDFGLGVGVLWEAIDDRLFVGASYQTAPGFDGEQVMTGELTNIFPPNDGAPNDVTVTAQLPDIIRLGARWHMDREETTEDGDPIPFYEMRLFGDVTRWSRLQNHCIIDDRFLDGADPYEFCAVNADGSLREPGNAVVQNLRRTWNDAFGFRLGFSYWVNHKVELQLDAGYDSNAIPDETLEPALMDFDKVTIGIGGRFQLAKMLHLGVLATEVVYFERDTTNADTQNTSLSPSRQPSSAGVYNQNVLLLNTNLEFSF